MISAHDSYAIEITAHRGHLLARMVPSELPGWLILSAAILALIGGPFVVAWAKRGKK